MWFNLLAPGKCGCNHKFVIAKHISRVDIFSISREIPFSVIPQDLTDD